MPHNRRSMEKKKQLSSELLNLLAAKMLSVNPDPEGDAESVAMAGTAPFKFMMVSTQCRDAMLNQFGEMKQLDLAIYPEKTGCEASFFKSGAVYHRHPQLQRGIPYQGPFNTSIQFIAYLMHHGKLGVERLKFSSVIVGHLFDNINNEPITLNEGETPLVEARAIDVLAQLIGIGDYSKRQQKDLVLDHVEVNFLRYPMVHLDKFLALDARELKMTMVATDKGEWRVPNCSQMSRVLASHNKLISMTVSCAFMRVGPPFPVKSWRRLIDYLLCSCPHLSQLRVQFAVSCATPTASLDYLHNAVTVVQEKLLPQLMTSSRTNASIALDFRSAMHALPTMDSHPLFKLGEPHNPTDREVKNGEVARSIILHRHGTAATGEDDRSVTSNSAVQSKHWQVSFHIGNSIYLGQ